MSKPIIRMAFAAIPGEVGDPIDLEIMSDPGFVIFDNESTYASSHVARWAARRAKDSGKSWRVVKITEEAVYKP